MAKHRALSKHGMPLPLCRPQDPNLSSSFLAS